MAETLPAATSPPRPPIVLLVDDEPSIRTFVRKALDRRVQEVHTAATAAEAQRLAAELRQLDLLITDVVLPDAPGLRLADAVRTSHPRVRVLLISGHLRDDVVGPGVSFLQKPFTLAELIARVREVLAGKRRGAPEGPDDRGTH